MKQLILLILFMTGFARTQDKPRVFVQGKGSQDVTTSGGTWSSRSTTDSHDESMEVTKNLQRECAGVMVTLVQSNADYTVILNRESKHNRGLLRTNSQIQVANRLGDIIGTNATRSVGNASKDACQVVLRDWVQHGKIPVPDSPNSDPGIAPVEPATAPSAAEGTSVRTVSAIESHAAPDTNPNSANELLPSKTPSEHHNPIVATISTIRDPEPTVPLINSRLEEELIGVSFTGNPSVRHDGVEISRVQPKGPADSIDIRSEDVILAINAHYLFTIDEVRAELLRYKPGARLLIRYRRNQFISENYLILGAKQSIPQR